MKSRRLSVLICSLVMLGVVSWAASAAAQPVMFKRSAENMLMGPLDALVAPYTAWTTLDQNMEELNSTGAKVATAIVGIPYNWGTYVVLGGFRFAAGVFEFPIGLVLWPVNAFHKVELGPFFDASESGALVDVETPVLDFKFGGRWLAAH